ncbi:TPA: hypothetical protein HA238_02690 [Candidatus Micrarchaeota archaeon]|nr:hypothetical protein [Candidatus Micrarchaeota archaeon]
MKKLKLLVVEDRAANLAHARVVMAQHKERVEAIFAEDFVTAEKQLRTGGIAGMLTDVFFPYAKGTGRIETKLFEDARPHCFSENPDFAAVDLLAKSFGEELREPLATGKFKAKEIEGVIYKMQDGGTLPIQDMLTLITALGKIKHRGMRDDGYDGSIPEWKRESDSLDADMKSGDETRQPCGILTMQIAHNIGIPFVVVSSLHAAHGSSASPVMRLAKALTGIRERDIIETQGYGCRGSTQESEQQGHVKDEDVWLKALVGLLEKIEKPDSTE